MSDYDGKDQAYRDLPEENDELNDRTEELLYYVENIAGLIYYQASLKDQDDWLRRVMDKGIWTPEEVEDD